MWFNRHAAGTKLKLAAGLALAAGGVAIAYFPQHFTSVLCAVK
jgi:hypothetical protein